MEHLINSGYKRSRLDTVMFSDVFQAAQKSPKLKNKARVVLTARENSSGQRG